MKVDVSKMMVGQQIQVSWRKQPILIVRHSPSTYGWPVTSKLADPNSIVLTNLIKTLMLQGL